MAAQGRTYHSDALQLLRLLYGQLTRQPRPPQTDCPHSHPVREAWGFGPRWGFPRPCDCVVLITCRDSWVGSEDQCAKLRGWFHGRLRIKSPVINDMLFVVN